MNKVEQSIYDLLKGGISAEDLTAVLNEAQKKIDDEKLEAEKAEKEKIEKEKKLEAVRIRLAKALVRYCRELEVIEITDEEFDAEVDKTIKRLTDYEDLMKTDFEDFNYLFDKIAKKGLFFY